VAPPLLVLANLNLGFAKAFKKEGVQLEVVTPSRWLAPEQPWEGICSSSRPWTLYDHIQQHWNMLSNKLGKTRYETQHKHVHCKWKRAMEDKPKIGRSRWSKPPAQVGGHHETPWCKFQVATNRNNKTSGSFISNSTVSYVHPHTHASQNVRLQLR
jgi:hypothetical protein